MKELKIKVIGKIYATLYTDGTLAFGKSKNPLPEKTINVSYGDISEKECTSASMPWYAIRANIKKADFVNKISPISTAFWFCQCENLSTINNIENLNTSNVTNMENMFYWCTSLTILDLSNFDTSKVTTMEMMFAADKNLTSLDLGSFDTSNVTTMEYMFDGCTKLKTIYIGQNWKLASKTNNMFRNCGTSTTTIKQ